LLHIELCDRQRTSLIQGLRLLIDLCGRVSENMCHLVSGYLVTHDIVIAHPMKVERDLNNQIQECQMKAQTTHLTTTHCFYQLFVQNKFWLVTRLTV